MSTPDATRRSLLAEGLALNGQLRWDEAVRHWQAASERYPEEADFRFLLGLAEVYRNEFERAAAHFEALRRAFPGAAPPDLGLGLLQEARQDWGGAEQAYEGLLARFPDHPAALAGLARCLVKTGRRNAARGRVREALDRNPASPPIRAVMDSLMAVSKSDIANDLVRRFGLRSMLEYNKPIGGLVLHDVDCAEKAIAYIPEHRFEAEQDARIVQRAGLAVAANPNEDYLGIEALLARYRGRQFDLIFYDPMHVRPEVDRALQGLPRLLKPDGFLVVHDCNPEHAAFVTRHRHHEAWLGETYKAFANFHRFNPGRSITVAEDFGVGIILNRDLVLDYPADLDLDYESFAADRRRHVGLVSHAEFRSLLAGGDRIALTEAALRA